MAVRGRAVHKNHNHTLYITELSPINHFFSQWLLILAISWKVLKGLKLNFVHT